MEEKRFVDVYKDKYAAKRGADNEKVAVGTGVLLGFGLDYDELKGPTGTRAGHYSTAIVEMPDGSVRSVPVTSIVFRNRTESKD